MNNINNVEFEGRITHDAEMSYTKNGKSLVSFAIANNQFYKVKDTFQENVTFMNAKAWNKVADQYCNMLKKGTLVKVKGKLTQENWKTKEGENRSRIVITVFGIEFPDGFSVSNG